MRNQHTHVCIRKMLKIRCPRIWLPLVMDNLEENDLVPPLAPGLASEVPERLFKPW